MVTQVYDLGVKDSADLDSIFMELASQTRRQMLERLGKNPQKLSQIAKELDLTIQDAHRNATRLARLGLIDKDSNSALSITPYGHMFLKQLNSFEFLIQHKKYFQKHTIANLPDKFVKRLGDLSNSELIHGIGPILERWKKMANDASKYIKVLSSHYPMDVAKTFAQRVKDGVTISYIFDHYTVVPKERDDLLEKLAWRKFIAEGLVKRKMLQRALVCVTITDLEACVYFPDLDGKTDIFSVFTSTDADFREWCSDYFDYSWKIAGEFEESRLTRL